MATAKAKRSRQREQTTTSPKTVATPEVLPADTPKPTQALTRVRQPPTDLVVGPMAVLQRAVSEGASVDTLERLLGMQERWEATQAKKAFDAAMAAVRPLLPKILKSREVDFTTAKGRTHYRFEDLGSIQDAIDPVLGEHGLSYRWKTDNKTDPKKISVTCIVSHAQGHSEHAAELSAGSDETGNKNDIQATGSTVTYLQRYTLKAAFGLAAALDDDGLSARSADRRMETPRAKREDPPINHPSADEPITVGWKDKKTGEKHYGQLERLISIQRKSGRNDLEVHMWLKAVYGYDSRKDITRRHYDAICRAIEAPGPLPLPDYDQDERVPGQEG